MTKTKDWKSQSVSAIALTASAFGLDIDGPVRVKTGCPVIGELTYKSALNALFDNARYLDDVWSLRTCDFADGDKRWTLFPDPIHLVNPIEIDRIR